MTVGSGGTVLSSGKLTAVFTTQTVDATNYTDVVTTASSAGSRTAISIDDILNITTIYSNNKKIYSNMQVTPSGRENVGTYYVVGNQQLIIESGLNEGDAYECYLLIPSTYNHGIICYIKEETVDSEGNLYFNLIDGALIKGKRILNQIPHYLKSSA
jgi:hypothetical protein